MDTEAFIEKLEKLCVERYADMLKRPKRYPCSEFEASRAELDGMESLLAALYGDNEVDKVEAGRELFYKYWKRLMDTENDAADSPYQE